MRKSVDVTIDAEGRDQGKTYRLTEMSASQAEAWAFRALSAMVRSGVDVPEEVLDAGWSAVAFMGIKAILSVQYDESGPLLAEMMGCVKSVQPAAVRDLVDTDTEEVATRVLLRDKVFELHAGFSIGGLLSTLASRLAQPAVGDSPSLTTGTSGTESPPSSPAA